MRSVSDIIDAQLRALGMRFQRQLAEVLKIDESNLSKYLRGERQIAVDRIDEWSRALRLEGDDARAFGLAVRLSHADDLVRRYVDQLELDKAEALALVETYEDRVVVMQHVLDALIRMRRPTAPPPRPPPWTPPSAGPGPETEPGPAR